MLNLAPSRRATRRSKSFSALNVASDASALVERCVSGRDDTVVVLLDVQKAARDRVFPDEMPGLGGLAGKHLSSAGQALVEATAAVLRGERVPVLRLRLPALTANAVGGLHMTAMLGAAFGAGLAAREHADTTGTDRLRAALLERLQASRD